MKKIKHLKRFDCTDEGQDILIYEATYNEKEQPLVEIEYSQSGFPISKNTHEYDENGKLTHSIIEGEEPEAKQNLFYSYANDGKSLSKEIQYADGSSEKEVTTISDKQQTVQKYDEDGEITEETVETFREDGQIEKLAYKNLDFDRDEEHLYKYNDQNQLIEEHINIDEELNRITYWTYDDKGRITLEETLSPEEELLNKHYYTYEGDNLMEEGIEEYESYDNQLKFRFMYDDQNRLVGQIQETYAGDLIQEVNYKLNERGDIEIASYVRTGLYAMLYGISDNQYTKTIRNELEYFDDK